MCMRQRKHEGSSQGLGFMAKLAGENTISGPQFRAWMTLMDLGVAEAASALGVSRNTITAYRATGASEKIRLACMALTTAAGKDTVTRQFSWMQAA